ncbi:ModD protein [Afifella marina]|uniref:Putative pyrophosphorylase ModD n=1 Tax=Afifella marina DSM 2698 TaxID=1120955 RepID=A0A1G5MZY0_AFIMA|nr:ModD protein [Afifella marina DSM 2698]MBK1628281.1 ModD protein [Afifella marina]MBK5918940.1 ModD protein [Afifella marina]RAI17798.1 ModD protein [Afifella marina DSM 2698]SCZ29990.1 putative molybdenum utilization protein ModD [Afifella marina DSM 2698]
MNAGLTLEGVCNGVLHDVDCRIERGAFVTLIGPSGAGKSTLLKAVAGLVRHAGRILWGGAAIDKAAPHARAIGYVPQDLCLFPHRSVAGNLLLALERQRLDPAARQARVAALLEQLRIGHLAERRPTRISGGEKQRVALARALIGAPSLLLLDEPFSSLDDQTRRHLQGEVKRLHEEFGLTTLMVTHDLDEAFALGDEVLAMHEGRLKAAARPASLGEVRGDHGGCGPAPPRTMRPTISPALPHPSRKEPHMPDLSDNDLDRLLAQDAPYGDLTTQALEIGGKAGRMSFAARDKMVLCGSEEAARMIRRAGGEIASVLPSGSKIEAGTVFLSAVGPAAALHKAWKVSQTLVEYASGIATRANRIVEAARAEAPELVVACTRKNFPGTKEISIKAVMAGGAGIHRLGLSETILVFPEHRVFLGDDIEGWMTALKRHAPEKKIVVESDDLDEAEALAKAGADVIQLEKLEPEAVAEMVRRVADLTPRPVVAMAGGVNEANAARYAATGCDVLVTSAPYFGRPSDVKITIERG